LEAEPHKDTLNPYTTNRPISDPKQFFGRKELLVWARERLVKGDRVLLLYGARRMGKTSFLLQLRHHLPAGYLSVRIDLGSISQQAREMTKESDQVDGETAFQWALCRSVAQQIADLHALDLTPPLIGEFTRDPRYALRRFLTNLRHILGNNVLLMAVDDLHLLPRESAERRFLIELVEQALGRRPGLRFLITATGFERLLSEYVWARQAPIQHLGPLNSTEAHDLLKSLAAGQLIYDPAAVRRAAELASGHPYYLQLLGYTLYNHCLSSGEVSLPDISTVLENLLPLTFDEFEAWWETSTPSEQAVLALLGELKGQGGVFTFYEIHKALTRRGVRVKRGAVEEALNSLADRDVLEHLGAISYRARIELFRAWLPHHTDLQKAARKARWRMRRRPAPTSAQELAAEFTAGNWLVGGIVTATVLVILFLIFRVPEAAKPQPTATPPQTPAASIASFTPARPTKPPPTSGPEATATAMEIVTQSTPGPTGSAASPTPSSGAPTTPLRGQMLYMHKDRPDDPWQIYVMEADGTDPHPITGSGLGEAYPSWSPHGRSLAFVSERDGNKEIYIMRLDGAGQANLTHHPADDWTPSWSPDGQWIAFSSFRDDNWELYAVRSDATELLRLTENDASDLSPIWSPDGQTLAFASKRDDNWEIYLMPWHGTALTRLTHDPGGDLSPSWSPDGEWLAFESTRDGDAEIYLMRADGSEQRNLTNWPYADEHGAVWSPDGGWIAFYSNRDGDWDIYVVDTQGNNLTNLTNNETNDQAPVWWGP
jgi:TolB protein